MSIDQNTHIDRSWIETESQSFSVIVWRPLMIACVVQSRLSFMPKIICDTLSFLTHGTDPQLNRVACLFSVNYSSSLRQIEDASIAVWLNQAERSSSSFEIRKVQDSKQSEVPFSSDSLGCRWECFTLKWTSLISFRLPPDLCLLDDWYHENLSCFN